MTLLFANSGQEALSPSPYTLLLPRTCTIKPSGPGRKMRGTWRAIPSELKPEAEATELYCIW